MWKISTELEKIQIENNIVAPIKPNLSILLMLLYFSGIFYLQIHINKTIGIIGEEKLNTNYSKIIALTFLIIILLFCSMFFFNIRGKLF